jgi:hypothetical protein
MGYAASHLACANDADFLDLHDFSVTQLALDVEPIACMELEQVYFASAASRCKHGILEAGAIDRQA